MEDKEGFSLGNLPSKIVRAAYREPNMNTFISILDGRCEIGSEAVAKATQTWHIENASNGGLSSS